MVSLKVLTLNCWDIPIPLICKDQKKRIVAIADALRSGPYDIVLLQEVWSITDFESLSQATAVNLPYAHYFYSGTIGSGMCILSKYPISDSHYLDFHLNGYAHKLLHGDWFGGKGVGLLKLDVKGFNINVYITHIHAEYSSKEDEYLIHRLVQSFQLSQFVKLTSEKCDAVIFGGDFNLEPHSLGYKVITTNAMLSDAWLEKKTSNKDQYGMTCETPTNTYTDKSALIGLPHGKRLDYILFRTNSGSKMTIETCETVLGRIPSGEINYSDHEGVTTTVTLVRSPTVQAYPDMDSPMLSDLLQSVTNEINKGIKKLTFNQNFWICLTIICTMILFFWNSSSEQSDIVLFVNFILKGFLTVVMAFSVWNALVLTITERNVYIATKKEVEYLLATKKTS